VPEVHAKQRRDR